MTENHLRTSSAIECVKAVEMMEQSTNSKEKEHLTSESYNTGQLFYFSEHNKIKAYEYWYKAAKSGSILAQKNLSAMCKEDPWACK